MITRVWGIVNSEEIEFTSIPDRPSYYEGFAPRVDGLQDIEIWAENTKGARGHLSCSILIEWNTRTKARLLLAPYSVSLVKCRPLGRVST